MERRWQRRAAPLALAVGLAGALGVGSATADEQPWIPPPCADASGAAIGEGAGGPWFRLDPMLDDALALAGQTLVVGLADGSRVRSITLDPESFAAGPFGAVVLTGTDDGGESRVHAIDVAAGCATSIATEGSVIRRATIDPAGASLYDFRVDRRTRADLGVWRRPLDGSSPAARVLDPLPADDRFGRTFTTELGWSVDGDRLLVTSCGDLACRVRTFDPSTGEVALIADPALGESVGLAGDRLVTYEACHGLPCGLVAVEVDTGEQTVLSDVSGLAVLVASDGVAQVVHETTATGRSLRVVGLDGRDRGQAALPDDGLRLLSPARATAGVTTPRGWIALARDGHAVGADRSSAALRNADTGRIVPLLEVVR